MAASAGTVTLELDANSVKLLRELQKTQRQTQRTANSMRRQMSGAFQAIGRAARVTGALIVSSFGAQAVRSIAQAGIAMERMQRGLAAATGSSERAAEELMFLRGEAERIGLNFETAGQAFTKFAAAARGTSLEGQQLREIFSSVSEASVVMGLSADQTQGALTALEQIISKGKVSAEELRGQLGERLPGAFQIAARAIGVTTAELDDMLKKGQLTAEQLLPALARELRNTFGSQVQNAAEGTQAAFNRLANAVFDLKAAFAESGLIDSLATTSKFLADITRRAGELLTTSLGERRDQLIQEIGAQEKLLDSLRGARTAEQQKQFETNLAGLRLELELTEAKLRKEEELTRQRKLQAELFQEVTVTPLAVSDEFTKVVQERRDEIQSLADQFRRSFETAEQEVARLLRDFSIVEHLFPPEERERIKAAILDSLSIEELDPKAYEPLKRSVDLWKEASDEMAEYSKQAARNIQDAFADFLFDPFEDGVKGMVKSFLDAIRRMLANRLAAQLFGFLGKQGGFLGFLFGGGRAAGGPVMPGVAYKVGERGEETFVPSVPGIIVPHGMKQAGGISLNYAIDARGADEARILRIMPEILRTAEERTINRFVQLRSEGRL